MKIFKKIIFAGLIFSIMLLPVLKFVQADQTGGAPGGQTGGAPISESARIINPINSNSIEEFIKKALEGVLKIGIPVIALAIIYCGFLFVAARGNSEKIGKAKDALLYTMIGAAILLGAWAIALLIKDTVLSL